MSNPSIFSPPRSPARTPPFLSFSLKPSSGVKHGITFSYLFNAEIIVVLALRASTIIDVSALIDVSRLNVTFMM